MYLHLGMDKAIAFDEIVGIFDLDAVTVSKTTRDFLARAEKAGVVENVRYDLPKSFILCNSKKNGDRIYIAQISSSTLFKRAGFADGLKKPRPA